ncbi:MAG TPA: hypothetical protein ENI85_14965, partial [Deltaproteobacteria bacterium]|nr:hypothetical protein [Deltaproteobacteria bacterium]
MDDVIPLPWPLSSRTVDPHERPSESPERVAGAERVKISEFDLDLQRAPDCPSFRGVRVFRDFLSRSEEACLLEKIETAPFKRAQSGKLKQHFGPRMNFNKRKMNASGFHGLPEYARRIETRFRDCVQGLDPSEESGMEAFHAATASFETTDVFVLRYRERDLSNLDFHRDDTFAYG